VYPFDGGKAHTQSRGGIGKIDIRLSAKTGNSVGAMPVVDGKDIVIITKQGQMVRIPAHSVSTIGRSTSGVKLIRLTDDDEIVAASVVAESIEED
jgi:DNA gyrase subunit A